MLYLLTFLSHYDMRLIDHLKTVADRSEEIVKYTKFESSKIAYISGLFHDLGKLNPYYQKMFAEEPGREKEVKKELGKEYDEFHSPYSQWLSSKLLKSTELSAQEKQIILMMIYSHHGVKRNSLGKDRNSDKSRNTKRHIIDNWKKFIELYANTDEFKKFNTNIELDERDKIHRVGNLKVRNEQSYLEEFIEISYLFSALLQADKGSFSDSKPKKIDFCINTKNLEKNTKLGDYRTKFQNHVLESIKSHNSPITIINAPTGIGKTKAFLDITNYLLEQSSGIERVFYFAPLLALTDDFESKFKECIPDESQCLTYNHIYSGTLDKKDNDKHEENNEPTWKFDQEAFNEKFIITTMHRLLMTIYSNKNRDSMKFASLRDSLLILDEVQTLPKFLLKNLCEIFKIMKDKMNTRIILLSATIPHELCGLDTIKMNEQDKHAYLKTREREIIICDRVDISDMSHGANLIMVNTRKEAVTKFDEMKTKSKNVFYISSGVTKEKQREILTKIRKEIDEKRDFILIATQVVESGVDISFSNIWRQMAPLDNIIQMIGRLDRENENSASKMYIFPAKNSTPYSTLEFQTSKKYLMNISNSSQLYQILPEYYKEISMENKTQLENSIKLENKIKCLDFKEVWNIIHKHLIQDYNESVYIPNKIEDWESIRDDLLSNKKRDLRKHSKLIASLPKNPYDIKDLFDEDLFEKKILYPKKDKVKDLYDEHIGLDKWKRQ